MIQDSIFGIFILLSNLWKIQESEDVKIMLAKELVKKFGKKKLIGQKVYTPPMGEYPGGIATIIEVNHDKSAPEISFLVQHPTWKNEEDEDNIMGIFEYEEVELKE